MQPDQTPSLQPIVPNPADPQYVPQPTPSTPAKQPSKRLLIVMASAAAAMLLLGGLFWWLGQAAQPGYDKAINTYRQDIKAERDALNAELDGKDLRPLSPEAKVIFENHGKKLQDIVAKAPKVPKVLGTMPASIDKATQDELASLTKAATDYASALRTDYAVYNYYTLLTNQFKPIKDLGLITYQNGDKVQALATEWPKFLASLKDTKPPKPQEALHADLVAQTTSLDAKIKSLAQDFATNSDAVNDDLLNELNPFTDKLNQTFIIEILEASQTSYEAVNNTYDTLDKQLKKS